jgi:hypothetical protein
VSTSWVEHLRCVHVAVFRALLLLDGRQWGALAGSGDAHATLLPGLTALLVQTGVVECTATPQHKRQRPLLLGRRGASVDVSVVSVVSVVRTVSDLRCCRPSPPVTAVAAVTAVTAAVTAVAVSIDTVLCRAIERWMIAGLTVPAVLRKYERVHSAGSLRRCGNSPPASHASCVP